MTFLSQASPGLLAALAAFTSFGIMVALFLIGSGIAHLAKWRERKVQKFRDEVDTAQKILLSVEKEKCDCQEKIARLDKYRATLELVCRELNAAIELKRQTCRKYDEHIQDLAQKVEDLEAAIKEKEDKIRKAIIVEIEIGSEKRRVSI